MTPGKSTIEQLFNGTRVFKIPFYQRSYVWGEKQWERLLADMISVGHSTKDYFLGAIILKQEITGMANFGDYKIVIDGQQRLTTLAIFLKVLYLKQNANAWFNRMFILPDDTLAIQHSHIDKPDFERVMRLQFVDSPLSGDSNIIKAFNYFYANLDPALLNVARFQKNVQVIDIIIDNNDDEQQIFDTINSLGVDLTTAELLKNHLFTEKTLPEYTKYWAPAFEKDDDCIKFWSSGLLKGRTTQKNIETFFNAFLQIKVHEPGINISTEEKEDYAKASALFYNYKKFIADHYSGQEFAFVKELVSYADIFRNTFKPEVLSQTLTSEPCIERINFLIYAADSTTMMPFVMYIEKNVKDPTEKNKIYDYLESYIVRRLICRKSTKNYSDLFSENLINSDIRTVDDFVNYINEKDSTNALAMPNNLDVLSAFQNTEQPNYRGLAILYLLESRLRNNSLLSTQLLQYNSYTLEHLMPQKWMSHWPLPEGIDATERIHRVKTLGNFTIITQSLNSTISNSAWDVKLVGKKGKGGLKDYAKDLLTLEGVLDLGLWDEKSIIVRSSWLASKAVHIWDSKLPNEQEIEEPVFDDDGELIIDEITGEEHVISRDYTQYSLDGQLFMGKSSFVPYFVSKFLDKHKKLTFAEIKNKFPDSLMDSGYVHLGLICPVSAYDQWDNKYKVRRYHPDLTGRKLVSADGIEFYVNTQWTKESVQNIIQIAKDDHWDVMIKI